MAKKPRRGESPGRSELAALEALLQHAFADRSLLERSLVHRSWAHEKGRPGHDSELPEFLGDAVLSLGVSRMLVKRFPDAEVGALARARAFLVSEPNLARKARRLKLGEHLRLGKGEERGGGRDKDSLLADAYEAVLAAIYLDGGVEAALLAVERHFGTQVARLKPGGRTDQDFKTDLQEALQAVALPIPRYRVTGESGPDHRKSFVVELSVSDRVVARGSGSSKKSAEQMAAREALESLDTLIPQMLKRA
ncbi:MAG TPA: ribonuclease III [Candidatus Polarisedimenticolia bacterium]|nr:ribonuclease III [Candidatus Polarisedimenticolia bacterium]